MERSLEVGTRSRCGAWRRGLVGKRVVTVDSRQAVETLCLQEQQSTKDSEWEKNMGREGPWLGWQSCPGGAAVRWRKQASLDPGLRAAGPRWCSSPLWLVHRAGQNFLVQTSSCCPWTKHPWAGGSIWSVLSGSCLG